MTDNVFTISDAGKERDAQDSPHVRAEVGGPIDETGVTLCVYGDDLIPEEISDLLGLSPTRAHRKGERKQPGSLYPFRTGAWFLELRGKAPREPEEITLALLDQLPRAESLWRELASRYRVELSYGLHMGSWNRGFDLTHGTLKRIVRIHAKVGFDIYADLEDEDE